MLTECIREQTAWLTAWSSLKSRLSTPMSMRQYEHETTIAAKESISALEFSPNGKVLASGCEDGSITTFSTFDWRPLHTFVDVSPSTSLAWHPRAEGLLFCGFKSGDVHTLQTNRPPVRSKKSSDLILRPSYRKPPGSGQTQTAGPSTVYPMILSRTFSP